MLASKFDALGPAFRREELETVLDEQFPIEISRQGFIIHQEDPQRGPGRLRW